MALAEDFAHAAQWEHFHILKNYLLGDVNGDGNLDVADVTSLISYILGENPNPFNLYKVGDEVEVLIKKFTPQEHRIALSIKDIEK